MNHLSPAYLYQRDYLLMLCVTAASRTDQGEDPTFFACSWSCEGEEFLTVARSSWAEAMNDCIDCKRTATLAASVRRSSCGEQDCNMKNVKRGVEREDEGKEGGRRDLGWKMERVVVGVMDTAWVD